MVYLVSSPGLLRGRGYSVLNVHMHDFTSLQVSESLLFPTYWILLEGSSNWNPEFSSRKIAYCIRRWQMWFTWIFSHVLYVLTNGHGNEVDTPLRNSEEVWGKFTCGCTCTWSINSDCSTSKFIPMLIICTGQGLVQGLGSQLAIYGCPPPFESIVCLHPWNLLLWGIC